MASMTLPEKVGQLLVPTVPGLSAADGGAALVRRYHVGGVIYFGQNIRDAAQVAALSAGLQQAARQQPPHLPLLIGTDQEGGIVSRLAGVVTAFPGQMAAGATRDPDWSGPGPGHRGEPMRGLLRRVRRAGLKTAMLSNSWGISAYPADVLAELFDAVVISAEVGMRKPEERIFRHAAGLLGLDPAECVFIDDIEANVQAAEALGMTGVLHTGPAATVARLASLLGLG